MSENENELPMNEAGQILGTDGKPLDLSVVNAAPLEVAPSREPDESNVIKLSDSSVEIPVGDDNYGSVSTMDLKPVGED